MPFPDVALYEDWPGRSSIVTVPPPDSVIFPSSTAAVHTELSSV